MIPQKRYSLFGPPVSEGRFSGSGGGGSPAAGGTTPYFCKRCGKSVPAKLVLENCDVCKKCRVRK